MITNKDIVTKVSFSKNLLSDQTYTGLTVKSNTAGVGFSVAEGLGAADNNSSVVLINAGGFNNQRITAVMKYVAPTTSPNEEFGVLLRFQSFESPNQTYYYAREDSGVAKITKVVNGTFTTLSQSAFALPQGSLVTITFQIVGNQLSATFDAGGSPATVNLSATDSAIPTGGSGGFRSLTSSVYCRSLLYEQL